MEDNSRVTLAVLAESVRNCQAAHNEYEKHMGEELREGEQKMVKLQDGLSQVYTQLQVNRAEQKAGSKRLSIVLGLIVAIVQATGIIVVAYIAH